MSDISRKYLKKLIAVRAGGRCEYCRVLEYLSKFDFHLEHIIGIQHGGSSLPDHLAYACSWCNWKKGPNIATMHDFQEKEHGPAAPKKGVPPGFPKWHAVHKS